MRTNFSNKTKEVRLDKLIKQILTYRKSSFYKKIWKNFIIKKHNSHLDYLPIFDIQEIIKEKVNNRIYLKKGLFFKIIYKNKIPLLIARTKKDISEEDYGDTGYDRPLVTFKSSYECIEKSLWLYTKNILPLAGEKDVLLTTIIAKKYNIDSIIGDIESIKRIILEGLDRIDNKKIVKLTIIDSVFEENDLYLLKTIFPNATLQLILSLPEVGALAKNCSKNENGNINFHPVENVIIKTNQNSEIIVTKLVLIPTPIINYNSHIKITQLKKNCNCENDMVFSLL